MKKLTKDTSMLRKAVTMGCISTITYLISYYTRNVLSVVTPNMLATGEYTAEFIGLLSSVYLFIYALEQPIIGFIGDRINPKYIISLGLSVTGIVNIAFPLVPYAWMQVVCFALMGMGLSMYKSPITKMISENLPSDYSRTVCTFLNTATFAGPLVASGLAIWLNWKMMFIIAGIFTFSAAVVIFVVFSLFEKKGMFVFYCNKRPILSAFCGLFKLENFAYYMVIGGVVGIADLAIGFWIPTYLSDALLLDNVKTNIIYSVISIVTSLAPFFTLVVFNAVKKRDIAMMRCGFLIAVLAFVGMGAISGVAVRIGLLIIAKLMLTCCSSVLWSIYIPGMGKTGSVSSINGVINCVAYLSSAIANAIFAKLLGLSWNGVVLVWCGIAAVGLVSSLFVKTKKREAQN